MNFTHFTLTQDGHAIGDFTVMELAVSTATHHAADTGRPVTVVAYAGGGSKEAVFNPDGTNDKIWNIDKGRPLVPTAGKVYLNRGGGEYRCLSRTLMTGTTYYNGAGGSSDTVARFRNVKSGWSFTAKGIIQYIDGTIEWDHSSDGHFEGGDQMSCIIMNPEPLAAIANAAETLLNRGYEYFGFDPTPRMHDAFRDCQTGGSYDAEGIYKKLWAVNAVAYNGRYARMDDELADETAPVIYGSCYKVHQQPEYANHHHAVRPWHYRLAKLLDFWLYQTAEDAARNDPVHTAMLDFQKSLFEFIVQRSDEYDDAPAWGKL